MKLVISSLDDVAEPLRGEYEARDGKFHLKMEGDNPLVVAANGKITEFRDKNIALLKEVEELRPLKTKFEGIDPDEARKNAEKIRELSKKGVGDATDVDERLRKMVDDLVKPLREDLAKSNAETAAEKQRADEILLRSQITDHLVKAGGKAAAAEFVVGLAKPVFEVKDQKINPKTGQFSKDKPGEPMTITEWMTSTLKEHDYLLEPSKGGGAQQQQQQGAGSVPIRNRDGVKVIKNPTPQELGAAASDIKAGKTRVEYDEVTH